MFEGGGVLGIAFLGALRCCDEVGLRWASLAGTSAGAITAALLAADYTLDELDEQIGTLDYTRFISTRTSPFIRTGDPSQDLGNELPRLLIALWISRQMGIYSTQPFQEWMTEVLEAKGIRRFADIEANGHKLKVVASDISRGLMLVLPDSLAFEPYNQDVSVQGAAPTQFEVSRAVQLSMSIPFFFEPGILAESVIVDGGITSNFPLWIYDAPPGQAPRHPTFGFRLVNKEPVPKVSHVADILGGLINTIRFAHDRFFLQAHELGRVININLTGLNITATAFNLTADDKDRLYARGYEAAKKFFLSDWSWSNHLASRGFTPDGLPLRASPPVL